MILMKRFGCIASLSCLGLIVTLLLLIGMTVVFMAQPAPTLPVIAPPIIVSRVPPTIIPLIAGTPNQDDGLLLVTVVQPSSPTVLSTMPFTGCSTPKTLSTPSAPISAAFFSAQTQTYQQSATAMFAARTAWYGSLTQGAIDLAATQWALGTPGR